MSLHHEPRGATGPKMKETKVSCFKNNFSQGALQRDCHSTNTSTHPGHLGIEGAKSRGSVWEKIKLLKIRIL